MIDGLPVIDNSLRTMHPPFDLGNPDLYAAAMDYVLVGRIEKTRGTRHPYPRHPRTDYDVTVLKVLKGNLEAGQKIVVSKNGGISESGMSVILFDEDDFMPKAGGVYVFLIQVYSDKEMLSVLGSYATVPLEDGVAAELRRVRKPTGPDKQERIGKILEKSEVFARYVAAVNNKDAVKGLPQPLQDEERYKSVYEK